MYSSNPNDNQTYGPPSAPPPYGQPATGIPAKPTNYHSHAPPPPPPHMQHTGPSTWSTGLCDCFDDPSNCCITCCCPCITFGQIAEIVDKGSPPCIASGGIYCLLASVTGFACLYSCFYRSKMRHHHMLPESPCNDCLVHCCCEACALCQEYRELQHRGFDMSLGWEENMGRQNRGVAMPPVAPGGMSR